MRVIPAYHQPKGYRATVGWYDTGDWVNVQLYGPLRSLNLIDDATLVATPAGMPSGCK